MLFIAALLATFYVSYLIISYNSIMERYEGSSSFFALIFTALVIPHFIAMSISAILIWFSFAMKKAKIAVISLIILVFAALSFLLYAPFLLPIIIFLILGFRNQERIMSKKI